MKITDLIPHIEEIKSLYLIQLWTAERIAKKFGVRADLLRVFLSKQKIKRGYRLPPPSKRFFTKEEREDIVSLYSNKTMTTNLVAKKYGCSRPTICKILKEEGTTFLSRAEASRKSQLKDDFFDKIDSSGKATLLGLIAADGHNNEKNAIIITLQYGDIEYLRKFSMLVYGEDKVKTYLSWNKGARRKYGVLYLFSKRYTEVLKKRGISRNKTKNLRWPKAIPKRFTIDFLRGFFDGDGSISISKKTSKVRYKNTVHVYRYMACSVYFCGTEGMMTDVQKALKRYKIHSNLNWCGKKNKTLWKTVISRNKDKIRLLEILYEDKEYALDRKYKKFIEVRDCLLGQKHYSKIGEYSLDR